MSRFSLSNTRLQIAYLVPAQAAAQRALLEEDGQAEDDARHDAGAGQALLHPSVHLSNTRGTPMNSVGRSACARAAVLRMAASARR